VFTYIRCSRICATRRQGRIYSALSEGCGNRFCSRARYMAQVSATRQQQAADALRVAQEVQQANRASMEAMARKQVAAGEAGISTESASYLAEMRDLERQVAEHSFAFEQRQYLADQSYELRARDLGLQTQQNLVNINRPVEQPNFLGTALTSALGSLDAYASAKRQQFKIKTQQTGAPGN